LIRFINRVIEENFGEDLEAYFNHYFREWGVKASAIRLYKQYKFKQDFLERELFTFSEETLRTRIKTFEERVGEDYSDIVNSVIKRFKQEVERVNTLAEEYNSKYISFENEPDFEGIGEIIKKAYGLLEKFNS